MHDGFVRDAIRDLLNKGLAVECSIRPHVVNPLTVSVQSNGKKRLILDLRHVNKHLWKSTIKFEDIRTAMQFIQKGHFCFKFDLHSAYHHIDIFLPHTTFLGFSWQYGNETKFFKFLVLPFGLSSACYIFTKVTRPLVKKWRGEGKKVLMYLDDGLGCHENKDVCQQIANEIKHDLISSGFAPKVEKSMWSPSQDVVFLGYDLDLKNGIISIPQCRLTKVHDTIKVIEASVHQTGSAHVRKVARLVGQLISMSYVVGNIVYIMTKNLSSDILQAESWNHTIALRKQSLNQMLFWKDNIEKINFRNFCTDFSCHSVVYSDASGIGYGGYIVENPLSVSHGMWSESEKVKSSTWRELVAVERVLSSILPFLNNKRIKWFSDNTNVVSIIEKGSMKQDLQQIALRIFNMCLTNNISLYTEWVPRTENEKADQISRIIDHDDWGVSMSIFQYLDALWGPHEIDFFASCTNNKLPVFYSRYWMPGATGIDAFTVDWHGVNGWFVPPVCIISRVLGYMRQCCAFGTVILPCWQSASFWPLIADDTGFISAVIAHVELPVKKDFYQAGKTGSLFGRAFKDDLAELPDSLADKFVFVADLISECKSTNTVKNYYSAFKKWKSWAIRNGIPESECLPAKPIHVALYLASVVQQSQSPGPVTQAFYGIRWSHSIISAPSPTESDLVKNVLEGAKRRLSHHVKKKEPITPQLLEKMFDNLFIIGNLYNQRTICACLLSYAGFLRVSELLHLKICDVCFFESHMAIFIEKSKTDVYRDGNWLVISKTGTKLCPVINLQRYFEYGNF
ncbi:hypothetical protein FSP39_018665 [Pinctada imbricata]|uniref:Tyr recombinase domain-containing protein n=1 Tax=Pinctada imbricata TaxID=66713 RepID=A0AA88XS17_PINIB|nr:hypothetical protein FSP39_018665 [Pinctada imbricata]